MSEVTDRLIWLDGELVPWERATVHVLSHSIQRGSLVFDYMSVRETARGPAVFRLDDHLERFATSTDLVGLPVELGPAELRPAVLETVRANPGCRNLKISAFLPSIEVDVVPQDPRISIAIAAYETRADVIDKNPGKFHFAPEIKLWIEKERRNRRADIMPPQAKVASNYTSPMVAKWRARKNGYDEIVLVDEHDKLAEAPTSNIFLVDAEGALHTPSLANVLPGITRRTVIELARHDGRAVHEESIDPDALFSAAEVFLTTTTAGVWPVVSVDGKTVGEGAIGPVSQALLDRLHQVERGEDPEFANWLAYAGEGS
ncbi:MAG: aminotransferase class IV [Deltaproteobacteria bacterium]|nr:aminotransferase class IV [Deltaproteobacteria bacterium]